MLKGREYGRRRNLGSCAIKSHWRRSHWTHSTIFKWNIQGMPSYLRLDANDLSNVMRFSLVDRLLNSILQYSSYCRYKFNLSHWNVSVSHTSFFSFFIILRVQYLSHCCFSGFFPFIFFYLSLFFYFHFIQVSEKYWNTFWTEQNDVKPKKQKIEDCVLFWISKILVYVLVLITLDEHAH